MNKSLKAFFLGYTQFCVNGRYYPTYNSADKARRDITIGSVQFDGWHLFKGWRNFYQRIAAEDVIQICEDAWIHLPQTAREQFKNTPYSR